MSILAADLSAGESLSGEHQDVAIRPKEEIHAELLAPEKAVGEDERTLSANAALRALARASRSYLIYDPRNDAIKAFLHDVKDTFEAFTQKYGDMELVIRPFEMVLGGKVVYIERDRERSLAYKLFRDGVRKITIQEAVAWEELTSLLEILSIRYVGIHMNEDDVLTLLWKAGFRNIDIEAIEGFTLDDEQEAPDAGASGQSLAGAYTSDGVGEAKAPRDFDLPAPELPPAARTAWEDVSDDQLKEAQGELASANLPSRVLELTEAMLGYIADPTDPLDYGLCQFFLREVRDFMMSEEEISKLLKLLHLLRDFRDGLDPEDELADPVDALLSTFTGPHAMHRLLQGLPRNVSRPPPEFKELLNMAGSDPLPVLMDLLAEERDLHIRRFTGQLIELYLPERAEAVLERYRKVEGAVAADLLKVLGAGAPQAAQQVFQELVRGGDTEVKLEYLTQVGASDENSGHQRIFLVLLMSAPEVEVRTRALEVIGGQGERGAFTAVSRHAEACAKKSDADEHELDVCGETMARVAPRQAIEQFESWAKPRKLFGLALPRQLRLRQVALAGLAVLPSPRAEELLRELAADRDAETADTARAALARRRRSQGKPQAAGETA
jgi:hypothetical protein